MSAVPKGRTRWSSWWVMGPAGLNVSDKSCDFILVFRWRSGLPSGLWPPWFLLAKKRSNLPSLAIWVPARESIAPVFLLHPTSQQKGLLIFAGLLPRQCSQCSCGSSKPSSFSPNQLLLSYHHVYLQCLAVFSRNSCSFRRCQHCHTTLGKAAELCAAAGFQWDILILG